MVKDQVPAEKTSDSVGKKDVKTTIIATSIVLILLLGAVLALLAEQNPDEDDAEAWDPAVGDYYTLTQNTSGIENYVIVTYTIIDVTSSTTTFNMTATYYNGFNGSWIGTIGSNQSMPYTYCDMMDNMFDEYYVKDNGYSLISTVWGYVPAHHYYAAYDVFPNDGYFDVWFYNGFLVKLTVVMENGLEIEMELTDTNIDF